MLESVEPTVRAGCEQFVSHTLRSGEDGFGNALDVRANFCFREVGKVLLGFFNELMRAHHLEGAVPLSVTFTLATQ